ncbi:hypothetical protein [Candidatus Parabeggiatoa sp. HSG14]|uniref:hypothetical protein n=1 Tax=Candidatus Parabeggiatoa sp. HSG14 TaxID=3055593 RepID=UPI0025A6FAA2|nr:hypothetical protein [Thiotrichales bacterium HSG14]
MKEFSAFYANRLSYGEVEELVERHTGAKQRCSQSVQNTVVAKALEVGKQVASGVLNLSGFCQLFSFYFCSIRCFLTPKGCKRE